MTLGLIKEGNLVLGLTQENLIENSIQDSLPYILITHGPYSTTLVSRLLTVNFILFSLFTLFYFSFSFTF